MYGRTPLQAATFYKSHACKKIIEEDFIQKIQARNAVIFAALIENNLFLPDLINIIKNYLPKTAEEADAAQFSLKN